MGHRKNSSPRRGSLAYRPRGRYTRGVPRFRYWGESNESSPQLLGHGGFKASSIHVLTTDDRERIPNFGKPLFNSATVVETPPLKILAVRAYSKVGTYFKVINEIYSSNLPEELGTFPKSSNPEQILSALKENTDISRVSALCATVPKDAGLAQKKPLVFETPVGGGSIIEQIDYVYSKLGQDISFSDIFKSGMYVDVVGITKGKGVQGPVKRFGIRRKQAKSRKTVREVAVIGPWKPSAVMYTIPRAGQMGFHKRVEYNKRILKIDDSSTSPITPSGGFTNYGIVQGNYVIIKGSIPGTPKRFVRFRSAVRSDNSKIIEPDILQMSVSPKSS